MLARSTNGIQMVIIHELGTKNVTHLEITKTSPICIKVTITFILYIQTLYKYTFLESLYYKDVRYGKERHNIQGG